TAPGHETILSGMWPAHTGIIRNSEGVQDSLAPLLGTTGPGASPRRFRGTTLVDWLKAVDPATRVLSVSRKDRGAILPVGRAKEQVYWYQSGLFTTSRYYADTLPTWVQAFNARRLPFKAANMVWSLFLPDSAYKEPDNEVWENGGTGVVFPHALPADSILTADHGVTSYPERTRAKTNAPAYHVSLDTVVIAVNRDLDRLAGAGNPPRGWLEFETGMLFLRDNGRFAAIGVKTDSVLDALA